MLLMPLLRSTPPFWMLAHRRRTVAADR